MTSNVPYLVEAMPDFFVELPEGWPRRRGFRTAARCGSGRSGARCRETAIVTKRIKPLRVNGRVVWTVGIPVHWGFVGLTQGSMANLLTPVRRGRQHPLPPSSSRSW